MVLLAKLLECGKDLGQLVDNVCASRWMPRRRERSRSLAAARIIRAACDRAKCVGNSSHRVQQPAP